MSEDRVVYREETSRWYQSGQEFKTPGVIAASYPEAFELLYGRSVQIPAPVRSSHRKEAL